MDIPTPFRPADARVLRDLSGSASLAPLWPAQPGPIPGKPHALVRPGYPAAALDLARSTQLRGQASRGWCSGHRPVAPRKSGSPIARLTSAAAFSCGFSSGPASAGGFPGRPSGCTSNRLHLFLVASACEPWVTWLLSGGAGGRAPSQIEERSPTATWPPADADFDTVPVKATGSDGWSVYPRMAILLHLVTTATGPSNRL
jgi:hypothetical protein